MSDDVPPEQQCAFPSCEQRATDGRARGGVCDEHAPGGETETPESPRESTEEPDSGGVTPRVEAGETGSLADAPTVESGVYPAGRSEAWHAWKPTDDGRKVPRAPWLNPDWPDKFVSAQNPEVWTDRETAAKWCEHLSGYALALNIRDREEHPDENLVLVDYDDARDPETGRVHPIVREHIERAGSYADVSTSGTGVHILLRGALPDGVKAIDAALPEHPEFPDAEIEVYDSGRFVAMTGQHLAGTPTDVNDAQEFVDDLADEYATVAESTPDELVREPEKSREQLASVEITTDIQDVFDAIQHTGPRDIRLRSKVTHERGSGSKSLDPAYRNSESGTGLAEVDGGWIDRKGMHGLDALQLVALEDRIISRPDEYPDDEEFWRAVEALRERGAHIPEYEGPEESEPVSALPLAQLDALSPHERRRAAKKRGVEWPSTDDARERLFQTVTQVMRHEDSRVIDAPTSLGKSHSIAATPWDAPQYESVTGDQPVVHLSKTREARDEAVNTAVDNGSGCFVLLGRQEACPVAAGEYDPEKCEEEDRNPITVDGDPASIWIDAQCEGKGIPFSVAHTKLKSRMDQDRELPCCTDGERCRAIAQWEDLREEDHALIEATHNFARVPGLRKYKNLVFDEEPDFAEDLSTERVRRMITALLKEIDAPVSTWEAFIGLCRLRGGGGDASAEADQLAHILKDADPDRDWYFEELDAHTLAPAIARAIFYGEDRGNGRWGATTSHEPPRLDAEADDDDGWNREWVRVVLDGDNEVCTVRTSPDLNLCRSVIGLDAHPSMPKWQVNTKPDIGKKEVLDPTERQLWRRYERGLRVVQVGEATRPYASGEYFNGDGTKAMLEHLNSEYGHEFRTCITASSVEERTQELMTEAGVRNPETMHYGEEKSRNDFADESVGFVNGSIDPGDEFVVNLLAELDLDAEPETAVNDDGKEYRVHGREFVGEDAETAAEILASVRENHVAQSAGRYARDPDDPEATATVFVRTDAMPVAFADVQVPGVEWIYSDQQRAVVEALRERERPASAKDLARETGVSKGHAQRTLKRLAENSSVQRFEGEGDWGADLYVDTGLPDSGVVSTGGEKSKRLAYGDSNTWSVSISPPTPTARLRKASDGPEQTGSNVWWSADRPNHTGEGGDA